jgi:hypothetical protein
MGAWVGEMGAGVVAFGKGLAGGTRHYDLDRARIPYLGTYIVRKAHLDHMARVIE